MGYRFDVEKMKISETGGIYVRTFPAADKITIDNSISQKPGIFGNSILARKFHLKIVSIISCGNQILLLTLIEFQVLLMTYGKSVIKTMF
jgi:hypothetical protein